MLDLTRFARPFWLESSLNRPGLSRLVAISYPILPSKVEVMVAPENPYTQLNLDRPTPSKPSRLLLVAGVILVNVLLRVLFPRVEPLCFSVPLLAGTAWLATMGMEEGLEELIRFLRRARNLF